VSYAGSTRGGIETEDAEVAGGLADFGKSGIELGGGVGFNIEEKLVFPGATVDGAAFDFLQVDAVFCERLERGEQGARTVGQAHGHGHFARIRQRRLRFACWTEEDKAGEVLGVVLDGGGQDDAAVVFGSAAAGDGCGSFITAGEDFSDAAGSVFGRDALEAGMGDEETFALR